MKNTKMLTKSFILQNMIAILVMVLLLFFSSFLEVYPIRIMQKIIDGLTTSLAISSLIALLGSWYFCKILGSLTRALSGRAAAYLSSRYSSLLRSSIFHRIVTSSYSNIEENTVTDSVTNSIEDVNSIGQALTSPIQYIGQNVFIFIWATYFLIKIDPILFLTCIPLGIVMWIAGTIVSGKNKKNQFQRRALEDKIADTLIDYFAGSREILSLGLTSKYIGRFNETDQRLRVTQFRTDWLSSLLSSMLDALWPIATVISLGLGGYRVLQGDLSIGGLIAFMWYIQWAINPISQLTVFKNQIQTAKVAYSRVSELLEAYPSDEDQIKPNNTPIDEITMEGVSYTYRNGNRGVINISLQLRKGCFYSIVGKTGSGKSTIGKLLNGLYQPTSGRILINNLDSNLVEFRNAKRIMSAYSDAYIFSGSLEDNLTLSFNEKNSHKKAVEALIDLLNLGDIRNVKSLSNQGEHGLSNGQKQRIAIGRLMYSKPDLLLLDEATSGIDSGTEQAILNKLQLISKDRIVVLMSHRLSSVLHTDYCYLINNGEVIIQGRPADLINDSKAFKELFTDQIY